MKLQDDNLNELISAYLDGELSQEDADALKEKISFSPELQKKLAEMKQLKQITKSSIPGIEESPYFETRLMANLEEKPFKIQLKRWSPVGAIVIVTFAVMVVLKYNPGILDEMVKEQKANLAGFYKENLQPLFFASDLTNEDIFNFAFYNQLPLDNTNTRYLQIGSDNAGNEFFEITTASLVNKKGNFEDFIIALNLDEKKKKQIDSLMNYYAEEIQSQVLVNDKNTVAISPNLWNFRKAIVADVMKLASSTTIAVNEVRDVPFVFNVEPPMVDKMVQTVKTSGDNEYMFFTPDTFFVEKYEFDKEAFKKEMQKVKEEMLKVNQEMRKADEDMKKSLKDMAVTEKLKYKNIKIDSTFIKLKRVPKTGNEVHIYMDSNFFRVQLDKIDFPVIEIPDVDSIINEVTKQVQAFTFTVPKSDKKYNHDIKILTDSLKSFQFDIKIPNIDSLYELEMQPFNNYVKPFIEDSAKKWFQYFDLDSSLYSNPNELKLQMQEFEKEMQQFREEMERMKKELRRDSIKVQQKKPVEI